jgi:hypothetical protein
MMNPTRPIADASRVRRPAPAVVTVGGLAVPDKLGTGAGVTEADRLAVTVVDRVAAGSLAATSQRERNQARKRCRFGNLLGRVRIVVELIVAPVTVVVTVLELVSVTVVEVPEVPELELDAGTVTVVEPDKTVVRMGVGDRVTVVDGATTVVVVAGTMTVSVEVPGHGGSTNVVVTPLVMPMVMD